jgi:ubiquinone/menaquinone biosynthesis C-methylase UbiE
MLNPFSVLASFIRHDTASAYERHFQRTLWKYRRHRDLAFAKTIGSDTVELFISQGNDQVALLKHHGLESGMSIYDLGCGCGRTAQALQRSGWQGHYAGADIVAGLVAELKRKCMNYEAHVHRAPSIVASDSSLDMIFHWSVFTHVTPEECFLYLEDSYRALKPGGKLVFSFLELTNPEHYRAIFESRVNRLRRKTRLKLLDTFLHRDWIELWAQNIGFQAVHFTDGHNDTEHPPAWQTVVAMIKPG